MVNDVGDHLEGRELSFNPGGVAPTSRAMQLLALNPSYEAGKKEKRKKIAFRCSRTWVVLREVVDLHVIERLTGVWRISGSWAKPEAGSWLLGGGSFGLVFPDATDMVW